jgi:hypothetical protein
MSESVKNTIVQRQGAVHRGQLHTSRALLDRRGMPG